MSGKALWQSLKVLVSHDKLIVTAQNDILATQKALEADRQTITKYTALLEEKKRQLHAQQKYVDAVELQAKSLNVEEQHKREAVDALTNPKEFKALEKELNIVLQQRQDLDDLLIKAWHQLEQLKKQYDFDQVSYTAKIDQLQKDLTTKAAFITDLEKKIHDLTAQRNTLVAAIPSEWLARYERMKHSVEDPIVGVVQDCCSACYYSILHQDLIKLKHSGVLLCRNCYRFLYYDTEEQNSGQQASY